MANPLASLLPQGILQFTDGNGAPLSGGSVTFYVPNTTTLKTVWADPGEVVALANPVPLDSAGRPQSGSSEVEIYGSGQYSMLVKDAYGNTIYGPVLTQDPLSLAEAILPSLSGYIPSVANIAALRTNASGAATIFVQGYTTAGDGGGGFFNLGTTATDNACTIIVSANGTYYLDTLGQPLSILQLGAVGNGATSDSPAFSLLATALPNGGTVVLPPGKNFYIATTVTVPTGVTIQGPYGYIGEVAASHAANIPWAEFVTITINSAASVGMGASSCLTGCLVYRYGMTFPTTSSTGFAGTAFVPDGDNVMFRNSLIMGFYLAINSNGFDRIMIEDMCFDNNNNINILNSNDTAKIIRCHAWPFSADSPSQTGLTRSGSNINVESSTDAIMITDCFSYGYLYGFLLADAQGATLTDCDADGFANTSGSGFQIEGTGANSRAQLMGCQAYNQQSGIFFSNTGGAELLVSDCTVAGCGTALAVNPGAVGTIRLHGSNLNSSTFGVLIESATVAMDIDDNAITGIANNPITATAATANVNIGTNNRFGDLGDATAGLSVTTSTIVLFSITPAGSVLALPVVGNTFSVTAGQNFGTLGGIWAGRQVTLVFQGVTQVFSATGAVTDMALSGGTTYTTGANSTLTLVHTGVQWYEVARG